MSMYTRTEEWIDKINVHYICICSNMEYAVVCFLGENTVDVVPRSWVTVDNMCWWPEDKKVEASISFKKAIEMRAPYDSGWGRFRVRILAETGMYDFSSLIQ